MDELYVGQEGEPHFWAHLRSNPEKVTKDIAILWVILRHPDKDMHWLQSRRLLSTTNLPGSGNKILTSR